MPTEIKSRGLSRLLPEENVYRDGRLITDTRISVERCASAHRRNLCRVIMRYSQCIIDNFCSPLRTIYVNFIRFTAELSNYWNQEPRLRAVM